MNLSLRILFALVFTLSIAGFSGFVHANTCEVYVFSKGGSSRTICRHKSQEVVLIARGFYETNPELKALLDSVGAQPFTGIGRPYQHSVFLVESRKLSGIYLQLSGMKEVRIDHAINFGGNSGDLAFTRGEIIVSVPLTFSFADLRTIALRFELDLTGTMQFYDFETEKVYMVLTRQKMAGPSDLEIAHAIAQLPGVRIAEPNFVTIMRRDPLRP